jgi:hypothetical protein
VSQSAAQVKAHLLGIRVLYGDGEIPKTIYVTQKLKCSRKCACAGRGCEVRYPLDSPAGDIDICPICAVKQ